MGEFNRESTHECSIDFTIDGSRLRVHGDKYSYEGWGQINASERSLRLYDAQRDDGEQFDTVFVHNPNVVERLDDAHSIELLKPEVLQPSPYDVRETDLREADPSRVPPKRHKNIYRHQKLFSYPVANRTVDGKHVLIAGHRRVAAAKHAGLEQIPIRVVEVSKWKATQMFVHEHLPYPTESSQENPELYTDDEIAQSLRRLRSQWSDDRLRSLLPVRDLITEVTESSYP